MRPPRGGGQNHAGPVIPTTTNLPFPQCAQEALAQMSKHVRLAGPARKRTMAPQYADWQPLVDNDIFCLTNDRSTTRLSSLQQFALLRVLAQFFTEKSEDSSKNAYFEAIFLGRQGETILHDYRIQVLFRLASFALQVPVLHLYMPISQWLSKDSTSRKHAEFFIKTLVEHFIFPGYDKKMYQYLLPLDLKCPEFTVFFITYAPKFAEMCSSMVVVCGDYFVKNNNYILNQYRDSALLAKEFAKMAFPKYLKYIVYEKDIIPASVNLNMGIAELTMKWNTKVKEADLDISLLWDANTPWTKTRIDFLIAEIARNQSRRDIIAEKITPMLGDIPVQLDKVKELRDLVNKAEALRKQKLARQKIVKEEKIVPVEMMEIDLIDDTGDMVSPKANADDNKEQANIRRTTLRGRKVSESPKKNVSPTKTRATRSDLITKKKVSPTKNLQSPASPEPEIPPAASPQAEIPPPASPEPEIPPPQSPEPDIPPPSSPVHTEPSPLKQKVIPM